MNAYFDAVQAALENYGLLLPDPGRPVTEPAQEAPAEGEVPQPLRSAMRYSLLLPGKRIRPVLLLAAYHLLRDDWQEAVPFACALEMIHTYSLIHDDLPAMDDDALRRGKPTNHRVYGEAMAILAGDGLLNLAYETMLDAPLTQKAPGRALPAIRDYCAAQLDTLWDEVKRFDNPHTYYVDLSQKLWQIKYDLLREKTF